MIMMMVMSELISWQQRETETDATICWHIHQYMTSVTLCTGHDEDDDDGGDDADDKKRQLTFLPLFLLPLNWLFLSLWSGLWYINCLLCNTISSPQSFSNPDQDNSRRKYRNTENKQDT